MSIILRYDLVRMVHAFRAPPQDPIARWDYLLPPPDHQR